jgi:hypothetical protein
LVLPTPAAAVLAGIATTWRIWSCSRQKRKFRCGSVENHGYRAFADSSCIRAFRWLSFSGGRVFRAWPSGFGPTSPPDVLAMRDADVTSRLTPRSHRACRQLQQAISDVGLSSNQDNKGARGQTSKQQPNKLSSQQLPSSAGELGCQAQASPSRRLHMDRARWRPDVVRPEAICRTPSPLASSCSTSSVGSERTSVRSPRRCRRSAV